MFEIINEISWLELWGLSAAEIDRARNNKEAAAEIEMNQTEIDSNVDQQKTNVRPFRVHIESKQQQKATAIHIEMATPLQRTAGANYLRP